jgi:long-subunit fatty acid transport protein
LIRLSFLLAAGVCATPAWAQSPSPTPPPERLFQDELDLQASLNVVQGSGARALGMGGAFLARADDATAASWNPAGLSYLRLPEASFVWLNNSISTRTRATTGDVPQTRDDRSGRGPDFVAFAYPYDAGHISGSAQISYQRVISFSSDRTISDPDQTRTVESSGGFDVIAFGTGLKLSRTLRAGLTVNHWFNGYEQEVVRGDREVPTVQKADFDLSGWNYHFGLMWSPWDSLNLGGVVKSGLMTDVTLARSRRDTFPEPVAPNTQNPTANAYRREDLRLRLPGAFGVGASWRPRSNLTVSLDFTKTNWSEGRIFRFFTLQRTELGQYPGPVPSVPKDFFNTLPYPTLNDENQQDTKQVRVGVEYVILRERFKWPIRAGYFSDEQFFRAENGSAPNFNGYTLGAGVIVGPLLFDVAYVYETGKYTSLDLDTPTSTSLKSHRVYASLIYRHQRKP